MKLLRRMGAILTAAAAGPVALAQEAVTTSTYDPFLRGLGMSVVFTAVGLALFGAAFLVMGKVAPFSIRKELEEDQNTALAIVVGSVIIGIAIIVAASIHG